MNLVKLNLITTDQINIDPTFTGTKRESQHWSLQTSFAYTWRSEAALSAGAGYTPNSLINTEDGRAKNRRVELVKK